MPFLLASIALLWAAPAVYSLTDRHKKAQRIVERVLLLALAALVLVDILPESFEAVGWWAILVALIGLALPSLVERLWHQLARKVHWVPLLLGILGLALHASIDGAAFVEHDEAAELAHHHMHSLPYLVLVHRFFEGMFIWWSLKPLAGRTWTIVVLAFNASFTVAGFFGGDYLFHALEGDQFYALFQALVGGSLLHLAIDRHGGHGHDHDHDHGVHHEHKH
jgi:hypothetical protein